MKKVFVIMSTIIFSLNSAAAEILVTTAEPTSKENLAELTEHYRSTIKEGDFVSSYEYFLNHPASSSQMGIILDLDSQGRAASLNGNFKKAQLYYSKLLAKLGNFPNVAGLEKITLATRINLAHMATMLKLPSADTLWQEAHAWDPVAKLSPEEFSPAVMLRFEKPLLEIKKRTLNLGVLSETTVYFDGQKIKTSEDEKKRVLRVEPGHHQIAFIHPGTLWSIQNIEVKGSTKPLNLTLKTKPFITGTCENPQFNSLESHEINKILVHFNEECVRVYSGGKWYNLDGTLASLKRTETLDGAKISDDLKPGGEISEVTAQKPKPSFVANLLRSPWFWAGVGAVIVGGLAISHNQTTTEPTHTVSN